MRLTFENVREYALKNGVVVERVGTKYEVYAQNNHSIVGECTSLYEVMGEIPTFVKKEETNVASL